MGRCGAVQQLRRSWRWPWRSLAGLAACADRDPPAPANVQVQQPVTPDYKIGPLDTIQIFVWQSPEFSVTVPVRPDGRISTPLIEDLEATGRTPTQLARDIEEKLKVYVQDPLVTVIVSGFAGPFDQQVRVVGEALQPRAIPYRANMTMLDVMIEVGGLTEFASGNRAVLARGGTGAGNQTHFQRAARRSAARRRYPGQCPGAAGRRRDHSAELVLRP